MAPILNAQKITKAFGAAPLFREISFTVTDGARIGLIGPNGSGKSTLLGLLAGSIEPDSGEVQRRKGARLSLVAQESHFEGGQSVWSILETALRRSNRGELAPHSDAIANSEWQGILRETLGRAGFVDFDAEAASLSGGWQKRLAIVQALIEEPGVLLLDEPTNHLDLGGIEWLESSLSGAPFACVVVSHDRYFLENVTTETIELNRAYPQGILRVNGPYSEFLEKKEAFQEAQTKRQETLSNRVRTEIDWLRRGPKARATKAKARIGKANSLIAELAEITARNRTAVTSIEFSQTERQSKRLIELEGVSFRTADTTLFSGIDFAVTAGMRLGLVGENGSGKTTLLRLLLGELPPAEGMVRRANALRTVYFDQNRPLPEGVTLRRALSPDSDSVIYQDRTIHVASWAARFLFSGEQLNQPIERLSGGERARVLIARLMLEPADVLLLDEPTNDLDIPTLEVLEESLLEFRGAMVLVTHDRYLLDRVSTTVLGLDGRGNAGSFANYAQWESWQKEVARSSTAGQREIRSHAQPEPTSLLTTEPPGTKKKLSYLDAREFAGIEQRIHTAEETLALARRALEDPAIATHATELQLALLQEEQARQAVDALYLRWAELEAKT